MTCIIGLNYKDAVAMAGDYLCSSSEDLSVYTGPPKTIDGVGYSIAIAGSLRVAPFIRKVLKNKKPYTKFRNIDDVTDFVDDLEECISERLNLIHGSSEETDFISYPFELMLISSNGLWVVESDLAVYEYTRFAAIGSGADVARGALEALRQLGVDDIDKSLKVAITAAGNQILNVGNKFWTRTIRKAALKPVNGTGKKST